MQIVTVSPKYQVVIPKAVRESLQLRPGQKMQVIEISPPPQRQAGKIVEGGSPEEKAAALAKMLREEAKAI